MLCQLVVFGGNFFKFKSKSEGGLFVVCHHRVNSCDRHPDLAVKMVDVLTNKFNCLVEPGADISFVVVLDGDALVEKGVFKMVGTVGRDVD